MTPVSYRARLVVPACGSRALVVATDAGFTFKKLRVKSLRRHTVFVSHVTQRGREVNVGFVNASTFARALSFIIEGEGP